MFQVTRNMVTIVMTTTRMAATMTRRIIITVTTTLWTEKNTQNVYVKSSTKPSQFW